MEGYNFENLQHLQTFVGIVNQLEGIPINDQNKIYDDIFVISKIFHNVDRISFEIKCSDTNLYKLYVGKLRPHNKVGFDLECHMDRKDEVINNPLYVLSVYSESSLKNYISRDDNPQNILKNVNIFDNKE